MDAKIAQKIVNNLQDRTGINLASFSNVELEYLKDQLEEFLDLEVDTEELCDPDDFDSETEIDED